MDDTRIKSYRDAARAMQAGQFDVAIPVEGDDGLAELGLALQALPGSSRTGSRSPRP